ncbi:hypothetical protein OIU84_025707 [Salix udensis]|uniref:Uncharacterized protein n=1 Tax=Salix udensis TaxID=889485 RepID=A0AAD6KMF5_9ROSI|nr:hypothetical protein OIU84_025707 [Salix udensis]
MEELNSLWDFEESSDELKQKLVYTTIELESVKAEANEELRKHKEDVKQLINLLKIAYQERDEAKVSSPDFSSINMVESSHMGFVNQALVQDYDGSIPTGLAASAMADIDPADTVIDNFLKGKVLPQKGKLLQAVMSSGPLLQTLLLAGPLPRWRNPPPLQQFKIPVSIKGLETPKLTANSSCPTQQSFPSPSNFGLSRGSSQMCSASMLDFATRASGSGIGHGCLLSSGAMHQIPARKRQRFQ